MDNDVRKAQIKSVLDSPGWDHIEGMIKDKMTFLKDPSRIKNNVRNDVYAREVRAGVKAAKHLQLLLKDIYLLSADTKPATTKDYE